MPPSARYCQTLLLTIAEHEFKIPLLGKSLLDCQITNGTDLFYLTVPITLYLPIITQD